MRWYDIVVKFKLQAHSRVLDHACRLGVVAGSCQVIIEQERHFWCLIIALVGPGNKQFHLVPLLQNRPAPQKGFGTAKIGEFHESFFRYLQSPWSYARHPQEETHVAWATSEFCGHSTMDHFWWQGSKIISISLHSNILKYTLDFVHVNFTINMTGQDPSISMHRNYITIHQATTTSHQRLHFPCLLKRGRTLSKSSLWSPATRVKWLLMLTIVFGSSPISHRVLWWFLHMVVRMGPVRFCHQTYPPLLSRLLGWPPAVRSKHFKLPYT